MEKWFLLEAAPLLPTLLPCWLVELVHLLDSLNPILQVLGGWRPTMRVPTTLPPNRAPSKAA